jgi:hypothetical protein
MVSPVTGCTIGKAKCLMCDGESSTTDGNSAVGINARSRLSFSWHVSAFRVCCDTNYCLNPLGIGLYAAGVTMVGIIPGVLFLVTCLCVRGIVFSTLLAVGLCDTMIPGASVIRGMVIIGNSLITLCSASFLIRLVEGVDGGLSIVVMRSLSMRNKCSPLVVWFTTGAPSTVLQKELWQPRYLVCTRLRYVVNVASLMVQ